MPAELLNTANALILGDGTRAGEAYLGGVRVWPTSKPTSPDLRVALTSALTAVLSWDRVEGAGYVVTRDGAEIARPGPNEQSLAVSISAASTKFGIASFNSVVGVGFYGYATATLVKPLAPVGLAYTATDTSITLNWTVPTQTQDRWVQGYIIKQWNATTYTYDEVDRTTGTSWTRAGLTMGTSYYFQVESFNAAGATAATLATITTDPRPGAPVGLSAVPSTNSILLSWSAAPKATSYAIERYSYATYTYEQIATTTNLSYTHSGLAEGTTYYYQVRGINAAGASAQQAQVSATTSVKPRPTLRLDVNDTSTAEVHFTNRVFTTVVTANVIAGSYMLQRKLPDGAWTDISGTSNGGQVTAQVAPAGAYSIGWWGATTSWRVRWISSADGDTAYSPEVSLSIAYRSRDETWGGITTPQQTVTTIFMASLYNSGSRPEFGVPNSAVDLCTSITYEVRGSEGWYCTGSPNNPYVAWWSKHSMPQEEWATHGPVAVWGTGAGWVYTPHNVMGHFSPFGWGMVGRMVDTPNPVWGVGCNTAKQGVLTVYYVDGYPTKVYSDMTYNWG